MFLRRLSPSDWLPTCFYPFSETLLALAIFEEAVGSNIEDTHRARAHGSWE